MKTLMKRFRDITKMAMLLGLTLLLALATLPGCSGDTGPEGPKGPKGSKGEQGVQGEVGPAGDDGNVMLAGKGKPSDSKGNEGDYYLNKNTGGLFGPKKSGGWGSNPIIVLKGDQGLQGPKGDVGDKGQQGSQGPKGDKGNPGEDGSQILAGASAPSGSDGTTGDFYLNKSNYKLYGPKTSSNGWGSPINLKGADGNANVTRYIFPGHDFDTNHLAEAVISNIDEQEMIQSAWLVYLVDTHTHIDTFFFSIPGPARYNSIVYSIDHFFGSQGLIFEIYSSTSGNKYDRIEIIRIAASSTVDNRKIKPGAVIPKNLNTDNYQEVAKYYGFGSN